MDMATTPDGRVWVASPDQVIMFDGSAWTTVKASPEFEHSTSFSDLAVDTQGRLWAVGSSGLAMYDGSQLVRVQRDGGAAFAIDSHGQAWISTEGGAYALKNGAKTFYTKGELPSESVRSIAVDDHDRVWFGTMKGLAILDGGVWTTYNISNSGLRGEWVHLIAVTGAGPNLPPPQGQPYGAITGRILQASGIPLANAAVEVCSGELRMYDEDAGETPCTGPSFIGHTRTDADGSFLLENLPAGYYYLIIRQGDKWGVLKQAYGSAAASILVQPGETNDLEDLTPVQ
jgi:hypothetical protein